MLCFTQTPLLMPFFKTISEYVIYLNIVIALSALALSAGIAHILGLNNYLEYGLFGFSATLCVYNSQRLFKLNANAESPLPAWINKHRALAVVLSIASGAFSAFLFFRLLNGFTLPIFVLMGVAALLSIFYVVKIGQKNIRDISYLKTHSIALTWTLVVAIFPAVNENIFQVEFFAVFVPSQYIYFIAVAVPFDIRDLKYDSPAQRTIPQIVGIRQAKIVTILLLTIVILGMTYYLCAVSVMVAIFVQIILIIFITQKRTDNYFSIFIDGSISLLGLAYFMT